MNMQMIDLRTVETGVRLTEAERAEAQLRHLAAMNDAQLTKKKIRNADRGLAPMAIGTAHVPRKIAASFAYVKVA